MIPGAGPRFFFAALAALAVGCDGQLVGPDATAHDAGTGVDGATMGMDAAVPDSDSGPIGMDAGPPPPDPDPLVPCARDRCWDTSLATPACANRGVDEDFSSGSYDVHDWAISFFAEAETTIRVERTAGSWQPAILILESDGTVLYDGAIGLVRPGLSVVLGSDGRSGAIAEVLVTSDVDLTVSVFVTSWMTVDSGFVDGPPTSATYHLAIESACAGTSVPCVVNGHDVGEPACTWIHYVAREVVPRLAGTRDEALDAAAAVAWWSLKEGVLGLQNPIVYSNCNFTSGDRRIGPLEVCTPRRAWQVGMSGVQVPGRTLGALEASAGALFPGSSPDEVLERTAREAVLDDATRAAVVASSGDLRISWLLRTSAIGFTFQAPTVTGECIDASLGWCYGTGWPETRLYAPSRAAALVAIADVRAILDMVAP